MNGSIDNIPMSRWFDIKRDEYGIRIEFLKDTSVYSCGDKWGVYLKIDKNKTSRYIGKSGCI